MESTSRKIGESMDKLTSSSNHLVIIIYTLENIIFILNVLAKNKITKPNVKTINVFHEYTEMIAFKSKLT